MIKVVLFVFVFVLFENICQSNQSAEVDIVQQIKNEAKKKYNADDADETINEIVQIALKKCGINRSIIVLQTNDSSNSYTYADPDKHSQEFMIIGTRGQDLDQIIATIYHELGHVVHGDMLRKIKYQDAIFFYGAGALSLMVGFSSMLVFRKYVYKSKLTSVLIGGVSTLTTLSSEFILNRYHQSLKECRADAFAYEHLVKHNKLATAVGQISDYLANHEYLKKQQLPLFVTGYPTDLQRAKIGLDVLQQQGINILDLIEKLPEDLDAGIKQNFPNQIKKFFPDMI